jgi:hypothetical protein
MGKKQGNVKQASEAPVVKRTSVNAAVRFYALQAVDRLIWIAGQHRHFLQARGWPLQARQLAVAETGTEPARQLFLQERQSPLALSCRMRV